MTRRQNGDGETDLVPWPVARARLGQIEGHPRRVHDEQGIVLSHLSFRLGVVSVPSAIVPSYPPLTVCIPRMR